MPSHRPPALLSRLLLCLLPAACADSGRTISTDYALPPGIEWVRPLPGASASAGQSVELEMIVGDRDTPTEALRVDVLADGRAVCSALQPDPAGTVLCMATLEEGDSTLEAIVEDLDGREASAETTMRVAQGLPPVLSFQAEFDEGPYLAAEGVRIIVQATDAEDAPEDLQLRLSSDVDGPLELGPVDAEGRRFEELELSAANHRLSLSVTDSAGLQATGEIWVDVRATSTPSCIQLSPAADAVVYAGAELRLEARVDLLADAERPVVAWDSDLDGRLAVAVVDGSGDARMTISGLRQGTHELLFSAGEPANCTASAVVVAGAPPTVVVDEPEGVVAGQPFELRGTVSDGEDAPEAIELAVHDVDGSFLGSTRAATDGSFAIDLLIEEAGAAVLELSAEDSHEMLSESTVFFEVAGH